MSCKQSKGEGRCPDMCLTVGDKIHEETNM